MWNLFKTHSVKQDYSACSACALCLLVCPPWRQHRALEHTPQAWAKALQNGACDAETAASALEHCCHCGACEAVCPRHIDINALIDELRRCALQAGNAAPPAEESARAGTPVSPAAGNVLLLPDAALRGDKTLLQRVQNLLAIPGAADHGADISLALQRGESPSPRRLEDFLAPLRKSKKLIVSDGFLMRSLRTWLPALKLQSLGAALSEKRAVRAALRAGDLYIIAPRPYHAAFEQVVEYYADLGRETGCAFNLTLHRTALSVRAPGLDGDACPRQTAWILQGRRRERIIVEDAADAAAFQRWSDAPVLHLAELV